MQPAPRRHLRVCGYVLAAVLVTISATAVPQASSRLDGKIKVELETQPLGEALRTLAKQANLQILFDANLVVGRTAPAIRGRFTPRSALGELLRDTGLEAYEQAPAVVVIRRRQDLPNQTNTASGSAQE
jgi:iron complex outermembrane receptor protein